MESDFQMVNRWLYTDQVKISDWWLLKKQLLFQGQKSFLHLWLIAENVLLMVLPKQFIIAVILFYRTQNAILSNPQEIDNLEWVSHIKGYLIFLFPEN